MKPHLALTDPSFVYVPSHSTRIQDRFAAERARLAADAKAVAEAPAGKGHLVILAQRAAKGAK